MNPIDIAKNLAAQLEADPVATGQVKEHIKRERLLELLRIEPDLTYNPGDSTDEELIAEVKYRIKDRRFTLDDIT